MRPPDNEPASQDIETLVTDEERTALKNPLVPDEVKSEIAERLRRFAEDDIEEVKPEDEPLDA